MPRRRLLAPLLLVLAAASSPAAAADPSVAQRVAEDVRLIGYSRHLAALCGDPAMEYFDEASIREFLASRYPLSARIDVDASLARGRADAEATHARATPATCNDARVLANEVLPFLLPPPGQAYAPQAISAPGPRLDALATVDGLFDLAASASECYIAQDIRMRLLELGEERHADAFRDVQAAGWSPSARYARAMVRRSTGRAVDGVGAPKALCGSVYRQVRAFDPSLDAALDRQPFDVLGVSLGDSIRAITAPLSLRCAASGRGQRCTGETRPAGHRGAWVLEAVDGRVDAIQVTLSGPGVTRAYIDALVADFEPRLGPGFERREAHVHAEQAWTRGRDVFTMSWTTTLDAPTLTITLSRAGG